MWRCEKGWPSSHSWWLRFQRDISKQNFLLSPVLGSPAQSTRAGKRCPHNIWLWKSAGILSTRERWESARNTDVLLKGQKTALASVDQLGGTSSCKWKDCWLDSCSEHMPKLWVQSLVGEHVGGNGSMFSSHINVSLSPFPSL